MAFRFLLSAVLLVNALPALAEDFNAPFVQLGKLPEAKIAAFKYKLSIQSIALQGFTGGISTNSNTLRFRGESLKRIPGDARMQFVEVKTTIDRGLIDIVPTREFALDGRSANLPDKPASTFESEVRRLRFAKNDEVRVRVRFKDGSDQYSLRYRDGMVLELTPLATVNGRVDAGSLREFANLTQSVDGTDWHCNCLSTWATTGDKVLWSTDVQMEGQPKTMSVLKDVLFVTTTAGHSFYTHKDTGEIAFYDKTTLPGKAPLDEILTLGRENMATVGKQRSLQRYIVAAVVLNDRRAIPFLIDCIDKGFGLQTKASAVAALEKFNGNPDLWAPKNPRPGEMHLHWVGMNRVYPDENRQAEMAKWRKVFADDLR